MFTHLDFTSETTMERKLSVVNLRDTADDLSIKWNAADRGGLLALRREIGNVLYGVLNTIENTTGERYRPIAEVDNL